MSFVEHQLRNTLIRIAQWCAAKGLTEISSGNFSALIPGTEHVLITPHAVPYIDMKPGDIITVDLDGNKIDGPHQPTSETPIHTLAMRTIEGVGGCVHVESPYVNALYAMNKEIPPIQHNFVFQFAGRGVALGPAMKSGTEDFAERTLKAMGDHFGVVWKNHGLFCVGDTVERAWRRCWAAEQAARVYHLALTLQAGEPDLIPEEVQASMVESMYGQE